MSIILHIETATTVCSVALSKNTTLLAIKGLNEGYTHAENLTLFIEDVCKQAQISLSEIDAVAVSKGPGSYTGLRIGVATAKGLCYALQKPLIAISTLSSLVSKLLSEKEELCGSEYLFCPMIDARRMEVYCAIYNQFKVEKMPVSAIVIDENSFAEVLKSNKIIFFGDGAVKCKEMLAHQPNAIFIENIYPSAEAMIEEATNLFAQKNFQDIAYFEPYYLKEFVSTKKSS